MAEITRVNGKAFGVVAHDRGAAGSGAISADEVVNLNGPVLDFFKIIVQDVSGDVNDIRNELDAGEAVEAILRAVADKAIIEFYQVEGDTSGQISIAVRGGVWTDATLQTSIRALGTSVGGNTMDVSGSTVSNPGFELT